MKNILVKTTVRMILILSCVLGPTLGSADESIQQITLNKQQKAQLVRGLEDSIARHKQMSREEIFSDLEARLETQKKSFIDRDLSTEQIREYEETVRTMLQKVDALDKDAMIALETAQLQQVMTSKNYVFGLSKSLTLPSPMIFILFGVVDIIFLPITFTMSVFTGF